MDELRVVPGVEALMVASRNHDEPVLDKDIAVGGLGVTVSYREKLRCPARLPGSDMNRHTKLFAETHNRSKIAPDRGRTKPALL